MQTAVESHLAERGGPDQTGWEAKKEFLFYSKFSGESMKVFNLSDHGTILGERGHSL